MTPALLSTPSKHTPRQSTHLQMVRLTSSVTFTGTPCVVISLFTVAMSPLRAADSSCVAACVYQSTLYNRRLFTDPLHLFHVSSVFLFIEDINSYIIMVLVAQIKLHSSCLPFGSKLGSGQPSSFRPVGHIHKALFN